VTSGATRRTLPPEERRKQIVDAVLAVVAEHGVRGASTARLAEAAGVSQGTLYLYFSSRQEMFAAAIDEIFAEMERLFEDCNEGNPIDCLRKEAKHHTELMKTGRSFVNAWVEFIAAGTQEGLRAEVARTQQRAFEMIKAYVEKGKAQGAIRTDCDSDRFVWQWQTVMWGENMSVLMDLPAFMDEGHSAALTELLVASIDARLVGH
jgi:AcrR family transcriptional regulator